MLAAALTSRRCLIVDDSGTLRTVLRRLMEAEGFECIEAPSGVEALEVLERENIPLVLTDFHMPRMDGGELLRHVRERWPQTGVIVITAVSDVNDAVRFLAEGALEYITKPFRIDEIRGRVAQALEKRRLLLENEAYRVQLEERVVQQARAYEDLLLASLQSLADALEVKDAYTWGHSTRVCRYAMATARELGVGDEMLRQIELGSRLHDLGKIGVREAILNKDGALSREEYAHVMQHPVIGWKLLTPLLRDAPHSLAIVRSHHERYDGLGTPDALSGEMIPLEARITAVADSFDAMTSGRPYRAGMSVEHALSELQRCAGTQFDLACVKAFERALTSGAFPLPDWQIQKPVRNKLLAAAA
ncbi:MAG: HD domain-containing phosphohydrolase [Gemmatimonadaceae bacterium]